MINKTSTSFRSIWLGILVLPLTNLAMAMDHITAGKVFDGNTSSELKCVSLYAKVTGINSTICADGNSSIGSLQKRKALTFSHVGFGAYRLSVVAKDLTNIALNANFITTQDIAKTAPHLFSHHSL
jgi:hypothetical protein